MIQRAFRNGLRSIAAAVLFGAVFVQTGMTQDTKPPAAEEVLKKAIDAAGGKAAHEKLRNRVSKGTLDFAAMGITGKITVIEAAPNLARTVVDMEGLGRSEQGSDGETLWELSDATGPRILEGEEREIARRQTTFNWFMNWQGLYKKIENLGEETVGETKCWKIETTPNVGAAETWFIDQQDHHLRRMDFTLKNPMGEIPVKVTFSDHRMVDGVAVPFTAVQEVMTMRMVTRLEEVKHNVDLPKDQFDLPEAIRELKDRPASKPAATRPANTVEDQKPAAESEKKP